VLDLNPEKKLAGVLAPLFALRGSGDLGIGDTAALKEMITWAAAHGFGLVQILPVNETGNDSSPYNLLSAMALEPSTIATTPSDLPDLDEDTFATLSAQHDVNKLKTGPVQYGAIKQLKRELLFAAFQKFRARRSDSARAKAFRAFEKEHADWLESYSLYRALISWNETEISTTWPEEHRNPVSARTWVDTLEDADQAKFAEWKKFHAYVQWVAYDQWLELRKFADKAGVALVGDLPVGVSVYSADVWYEPGIFDLVRSSGAPPEKVFKSDPFTEQWGQNWGFPLYAWERMSRDDFAWWRRRLRLLMRLFHLIRVDHALGFFRIYSFPWRPEDNEKFIGLTPEQAVEITKGPLPGFIERDDSTEENRQVNQLHGEAILKVFVEEVGPHRLIAEDLGEVAPYVRPTLARLEIPGFKIPQWERVEWDRLTPGPDYQRLSLATFATHDHPPVKTVWDDLYKEAQSEDAGIRDHAIHVMWEFMNFCGQPEIKLPQPYTEEIHQLFVRGLFASNSWLAVHMVTDLLGTDERFNVPGSSGDQNWTERLPIPISGWDSAWKPVLEGVQQAMIDTGRCIKL
jgi:4-alpha-glucanotransferase